MCDEKGKIVFYIVCELGNINIVKYLLLNGVDVNLCELSGVSFFFILVFKGYFNVLKLLLDNGVDINLCCKLIGSILYLIVL